MFFLLLIDIIAIRAATYLLLWISELASVSLIILI